MICGVDLLYDLLEEEYKSGRHVDAAERPSESREQRGSARARRNPHRVQGVSRRLQTKTSKKRMVELEQYVTFDIIRTK